MLRASVLSLLATVAHSDIVVSRTINSVTAGNGTVTVEGSACSSKDAYGSNNCDIHWGTNYTIDLDLTLATDIVAGHKFNVDIHVDTFFPLKFSCPICGSECSFTIPVIKKTVSFQLPACPLKAGAFKQSIVAPLPSSSPVPIKASAKGKVTVTDPSGATVADVDVTGSVSPSLVEAMESNGQCKKDSYAFCCGVGTPCDCTKGTTSPGQCKPESYAFCCDVGTPCDCTKPGLVF